MPRVPFKKMKNARNYTVSEPYNHIWTVSTSLSVSRHQKCAVRWRGGGILEKEYSKRQISNQKFLRG